MLSHTMISQNFILQSLIWMKFLVFKLKQNFRRYKNCCIILSDIVENKSDSLDFNEFVEVDKIVSSMSTPIWKILHQD